MRIPILKYLLLIVITFVMVVGSGLNSSVFADGSFTVTFHSGSDGAFDGGSTTNTVTYASDWYTPAHSWNLDDNGNKLRYYYQSGAANKAITISGAARLEVDLTYQLYGGPTGESYLSIFKGTSGNGTAAANRVAYLGDTELTNAAYEVQGNTVQFWWRSTLSDPTPYGWYAEVRGYDANDELIMSGKSAVETGEYKEPQGNDSGSSTMYFLGWSENPDGSGDLVDVDSLTSSTDLYAVYESRSDITSGTFGGCSWRIQSDGTLLIGEEGQNCTMAAVTTSNAFPWYQYRQQVTSAKIAGSVNVPVNGTVNGMFHDQANNKSIDLTGLNTSNATDFSRMFYGCSSLQTLDLGDDFDTSNGTNFTAMFYSTQKLNTVDLGDKFDTSRGTSFHQMFLNSGVYTVDLGDRFDTGSATNISDMFRGCNNLTELDLGDNFDTSNVTNFTGVFRGCSQLIALDLGDKFDTSSGTAFDYLFADCSRITALDLGDKFDTSNGTKFNNMFSGCSKLPTLDLGDKFDTSKSTTFDNMFSGCSSLVSLDLGDKFDTSKATDFGSTFSGCSSLPTLDLGDKFDTSSGTKFSYMFYNCTALPTIDLGDKFDTSSGTNFEGMFNLCRGLTELDLGDKFDTAKSTTFRLMFAECSSLTELSLGDKFDTANSTQFGSMFKNCSSLETLDLGDKFDTSKGTLFDTMFASCSKLTNIDLGDKFNTSNGTRFDSMFSGCSKLESMDLGDKFDTSNGTQFQSMFNNCTSLVSLDLGDKFDTGKGTQFQHMFNNCPSLTSLDLGDKFFTSQGTNFQNMFSNCVLLETLDLSTFDTSKATNMKTMFGESGTAMKSLKGIILGPDFTFEGAGSITGNNRAAIPSPQYPARNWNRVYDLNNMQPAKGDARMIMSAEELRDNWDGSTMAGLWVWDTVDPTSMGYGDETRLYSDAPKWSIVDESTWVYNFAVFDDSIPFYLIEDPMDGFTSDIDPLIGYTQAENKVVEITNRSTRQTGDLTIRKIVSGADTDEKFNFTVTLSGVGIDPDGVQVIDDLIFTNGVANINLAAGETRTISGIPEGVTYTVTENDVPAIYEVTSSNETGTIIREGSMVTFTNTKEETQENPEFTDLKLKKMTENADEIDEGKEYAFDLQFTGLSPGTRYTIVSDSQKQHPGMNMYFTADSEGDGFLNVALWDEETLTFKELPAGARYKITEPSGEWISSYRIANEDANGHIVKNRDENLVRNKELSTEIETVDPDEITVVTFKNTYKDTETIVVEKAVEGDENDNSKFEFHIQFSDMNDGDVILSSIGRIIADSEGKAEREFYLSAGEQITFEEIPVGAKYRVTEAASLYTASYLITDSSDTYVIKRIAKASDANADANTELSTAEETVNKGEDIKIAFTNRKDTGSLLVRKEGTENIDPDTEFQINVKVEGTRFPITGTFTCTGAVTSITLDKTGSGTLTLKKGESVTITGLPIGSTYTVQEYDPGDIYSKTYSNESGEIEATTQEVTILNDFIVDTDLTVKKTVSGSMANRFRDFEFTITLTRDGDPVEGTFDTEGTDASTITLDQTGKGTFTLRHGQEITIRNLPVGSDYTITERNYENDGYITESQGATGVLDEDAEENEATFVNRCNVQVPTSFYVSTTATVACVGGLLIYILITLRKRAAKQRGE